MILGSETTAFCSKLRFLGLSNHLDPKPSTEVKPPIKTNNKSVKNHCKLTFRNIPYGVLNRGILFPSRLSLFSTCNLKTFTLFDGQMMQFIRNPRFNSHVASPCRNTSPHTRQEKVTEGFLAGITDIGIIRQASLT